MQENLTPNHKNTHTHYTQYQNAFRPWLLAILSMNRFLSFCDNLALCGDLEIKKGRQRIHRIYSPIVRVVHTLIPINDDERVACLVTISDNFQLHLFCCVCMRDSMTVLQAHSPLWLAARFNVCACRRAPNLFKRVWRRFLSTRYVGNAFVFGS